jgi:MscS family membrane protein
MKMIMQTRTWLFLFVISILYLSVLTGCGINILPTERPPEESTPPAGTESAPDETTQEESQIIITPTLAPTATPGPIDELVSVLAESSGLNQRKFLGLTGEDWINLIVSLALMLLGIFLIAHLVYAILMRIARASTGKYDDLVLESVGIHIRRFISMMFIQFATNRLMFLNPELKQALNQAYFTVYVIIGTMLAWRLIDLGVEIYEEKIIAEGEKENPFLPIIRRVGYIALLLTSAIMILNNLGVNVTGLVALLGVGGLAFSLAAQDTLADAISGFIILMDRPFREGDRIEIQDLGTWGDVIAIGTRTTRIRTRDNRLVIIPNSIISKSQIVNYTYPDPRYRVQIEIGVEYGVNLHEVREIIIKAVRDVEGVLQDKPIDVLFLAFGDPALILRIRWWIVSYVDTRRMFDRVNEAIYLALNQAKIDMPPTMYDVRILKDLNSDQTSYPKAPPNDNTLSD